MIRKNIDFFFVVLVLFAGLNANAQLTCASLLSEPIKVSQFEENSNFQKTLEMLTRSLDQNTNPVVLSQLSVFKKLQKIDSKIDLLAPFNIQRLKSSDGQTHLSWRTMDLSQPKAASAALVKMSRLIAFENFHSIRLQKNFFKKIRDLKSDTLDRIEVELYLKALLQAEGHLQKTSDLAMFLPWNILRIENVRLDQKMIDTLNSGGLEAFHEVLVARYGWKVSANIVQNTSKNITKVAGIISAAIIFYLYQKGDDYFNKTLMLETGMDGEDHNLFAHILKVSGLKNTKDVVDWIGSQKTDDPDLILFQHELSQELKK